MTNKTKQYKLLTLSAILLITSAVYSNAQMESARTSAAQFETMDVQELINVQSQEMTLPQPESRSGKSVWVVNELLPAVKKGFFESENRYLQRGKDAARAALSILFPGAESADIGARMHKCGMEPPGYDGLRAEAKWEHEGWKYSAEIFACHRGEDPFMVKYVAITPADGDKGKMPKTKDEFIHLVNALSRFQIENAEEKPDWKGRMSFKSDLGGSAYVDLSYTGIFYWFSEDVGAIFFQWLNDADVRYLKK